MWYNYNEDNDGVNELLQMINSQQNLKKIIFQLSCNFHHLLLSLKNSNCTNTLRTIILYRVNFKNIYFSNEVFEQLKVLESIHIIHCYYLNNFIQQIIDISNPFKLKSLFISDNDNGGFKIELIQLLFQKYGKYLENIGLFYMHNKLKQKFILSY